MPLPSDLLPYFLPLFFHVYIDISPVYSRRSFFFIPLSFSLSLSLFDVESQPNRGYLKRVGSRCHWPLGKLYHRFAFFFRFFFLSLFYLTREGERKDCFETFRGRVERFDWGVKRSDGVARIRSLFRWFFWEGEGRRGRQSENLKHLEGVGDRFGMFKCCEGVSIIWNVRSVLSSILGNLPND